MALKPKSSKSTPRRVGKKLKRTPSATASKARGSQGTRGAQGSETSPESQGSAKAASGKPKTAAAARSANAKRRKKKSAAASAKPAGAAKAKPAAAKKAPPSRRSAAGTSAKRLLKGFAADAAQPAKKKKKRKSSKKPAPAKTATGKAAPAVSPLAPKSFPDIPPIDGIGLMTGRTGMKYRGRDDLLFVRFAENTQVAGVFTQSATASPTVDWCVNQLDYGVAGGLVVNAGNANAFTGKAGMEAVRATVAAAAKVLGCRQRDVFVASTGVIGQPLDHEKITALLPGLADGAAEKSWEDAARAIMTTDTYPKACTRTAVIDGTEVRIAGIAKGSGMIAPNMATTLAFIFTDAFIPSDILQTILILEVRDSFNAITVDSDTSTNDMILAFASGKAEHAPISRAGDPRLKAFREQLAEVLADLAQQVVRDGEGATKFITVNVTGAASAKSARTIAMSIANSPLVKTAVAGEDPNWGRIVMAVGKAGEPADRDKLAIHIGETEVARAGAVVPGYDERPVARYMKGSEIEFTVDVGVGTGSATVWTCDLTHGYISINADYRS